MRNTTVRRTTLAIAVVAALTGVAACGSSGSSDGKGKATGGALQVSPIAALRTAEQSTDKANSAKVESTTTIGTVMAMTAKGSVRWGQGLNGTLTIDYTGGTMAEAMRKTGSTSMEARYLPDAYYAHMSDTFARQSGGKHWLRYGYDDLAKIAGGSGAFLKDQMQNSTPNQSVKLLLASGDVKKAGEATVRGEHTTHYAGTVSVADLAAKTSHLPQSQLDQLKKQLAQAGVTTETVDIWVNDQQLLVKSHSTAHMTMGDMDQTSYYSDYGVQVLVQKPAASDTMDFAQLLKKLGGSPNTAVGSGSEVGGSGASS
ncbi:hypothetical protein [Streptomyces sp. NPDC006739]|uniref:hypothetical protein n=1 Tax=Streptomyces sp. NPDC006739 TaxID=3364763 RepID=UPI003688F709